MFILIFQSLHECLSIHANVVLCFKKCILIKLYVVHDRNVFLFCFKVRSIQQNASNQKTTIKFDLTIYLIIC